VPEKILALVAKRQQARAAKRWAEADALRGQIRAGGYEVQDTPEGSSLLRSR
jgi:cysteinyl-tRNA synthetase